MTLYHTGIPPNFLPFFIQENSQKTPNTSLLVILANEKRVAWCYDVLKALGTTHKLYKFPAFDCLPYDRISPAQDISAERARVLTELVNFNEPVCVIASPMAILQRVAPKKHFVSRYLHITEKQHIPFQTLVDTLISLGYKRRESVCEPGDFALRGSIIDCFSPHHHEPVRIDFFGDDLDCIKTFDPTSQKTTSQISQITIMPVCEILLDEENRSLFRSQFRSQFPPSKTMIYNDPLYNSISEGRTYNGFEHWLPLFFESTATLLDYVNPANIYMEEGAIQTTEQQFDLIVDYYKARLQPMSHEQNSYYALLPEQRYISPNEWKDCLKRDSIHILCEFQRPDGTDHQVKPISSHLWLNKTHFEEAFKSFIEENRHKRIVFVASLESAKQRLKDFFSFIQIDVTEINEWPHQLHGYCLLILPLEHGFEHLHELVITDQDIFGERQSLRKVRKSKSERFFQELSNLAIHDIVVHREHGVARYEGLEAILVGDKLHDCLKLVYEGNDKLFLPVENIDLISRYGNEQSIVQLDKLGSHTWQTRKAKVKKRLAIIAEYLIQTAAERSLHKASALEIVDHSFEDFCRRFPYVETDDQLSAIQETLQDVASGKPMDRLICGDVGFGKTEIAIRSAFIAAQNQKQVAIITPTSLLCRQHFYNFKERFRGFPFTLAQLSRLVSTKEAQKIKAQIRQGDIHIVVGTHALLSDQISFADLGLLIIDEEHHFGVKQKEKLKILKNNVHVLTMTATPIPRTLQLALSGVRDLSLITTPPIDRLAVRTFVMPLIPLLFVKLFCVSLTVVDKFSLFHHVLKTSKSFMRSFKTLSLKLKSL